MNVFYLKSTQITSFSSVTPLFITDIDYRISRTSMPDTIIRVLHGQTTENYNFIINGTITGIGIDPNNWILNKVGSITKDINLSISDNSQNEEAFIFIGPNPTSDVLNIYLYNKQDAVLELTDIQGKLIQSANFTAHYEYDLSHSANGVYMATIKDKSGNVIQSTKVIKN